MIPYMVGKLVPNSPHWTRGLVRYVSGRSYFRAVPSQNRDKFVTSPRSPIVERVMCQLRQRTFSATARLSGATPPRVTVSATLTEDITRHLQVAPSRAASAVPPTMKYRPTFTGCTNPSHASKARSRYSRYPLLDSSGTVKPHM